jgi:hypothetical protein
MPLVIRGRIVPLDRDEPDAVFSGRVWIADSGLVEAVTRGTAPAPAGFTSAHKVDVGDALVLPAPTAGKLDRFRPPSLGE